MVLGALILYILCVHLLGVWSLLHACIGRALGLLVSVCGSRAGRGGCATSVCRVVVRRTDSIHLLCVLAQSLVSVVLLRMDQVLGSSVSAAVAGGVAAVLIDCVGSWCSAH